jgi:hypothetical protein
MDKIHAVPLFTFPENKGLPVEVDFYADGGKLHQVCFPAVVEDFGILQQQHFFDDQHALIFSCV